jgi:hypothetical protein
MGEPRERSDDRTVEDVVEESAFERDEKQVTAHPIRRQALEIPAAWRRTVADGILDPVQVVQHVRRAQVIL